MGKFDLNQLEKQTKQQNYPVNEGHYVFVGEIEKVI